MIETVGLFILCCVLISGFALWILHISGDMERMNWKAQQRRHARERRRKGLDYPPWADR